MINHPQLWPTPQDYNETIQNPHICFEDSDLRTGKVETTPIGLPRSASGTFASVYKIKSPGGVWAVRCFLTFRTEQKERYLSISKFVQFDDLDCTVAFDFIEQGIKVSGQWYPIVKMPWIDGPTMDTYVAKNYRDGAKMLALRNAFYELSMSLETAGIAHGDLQHGNIIVNAEGLRLVDYDAFFVPELSGQLSLEFGHPNYQHPMRDDYYFDVSVDNFSSWLIYASLTALCYDPGLFEQFDGADDCILFKRADLLRPESSNLFATLLSHESHHVRESATVLQRMLWLPPHLVPALNATKEELANLPAEKPDSWDLYRDVQSDNRQLQEEIRQDSSQTEDLSYVQQRKSAKKPQKQTAKQKAKSVFHKVIRSATPSIWASMQTNLGEKHFQNCEYEEALACFLSVREAQTTKYKRERVLELLNLLKLAACSVYVHPKNQTDNYCLLAAQVAGAQAKRFEAVEVYGGVTGLQEMYRLLCELLTAISRRGSEKDPEVLRALLKLIEFSNMILCANDSQKVMVSLSELIVALFNNSRIQTTPDDMRNCAAQSLRYAGSWAKIYGAFELEGNFSKPWKNLCKLTETLTEHAADPVLAIEQILVSRACQNIESVNTDLLYKGLSDENSFQQALLNAIDILGVELAMQCFNAPIQKITDDDVAHASDIVFWLWTKAVLDEHAFEIAPRIAWLKNFKDDIRARCLDPESTELICRRIETDFASVRFVALTSATLRALSELGVAATDCREAALAKMIELAKANAPRLNVLEMFSVKRIIRDNAVFESPAWHFGDTFHNQVNLEGNPLSSLYSGLHQNGD
ncbi:hypothetical protein KF707_04460 [Candidatus Obscuribacterales bacterium]|nr:hypothetical protein [Candidatus Obscuribacterales bacterium]